MRKTGSMNHIYLTVTEVARARKIYDPFMRFMDYELVYEAEDTLTWGAPTAYGGMRMIYLVEASEEGRNRKHDRYSPGLHHFAWNAESREEVDRFYDLLLEIGAEILDPPAEYPDYDERGYYAVYFADPDGLKLELVYIPEDAELS